MVGPPARDATPPGAGTGPGRPASRGLAYPGTLVALATSALALASLADDAGAALRLAAGSFALAALALAVALPWALACLLYLSWYAPPGLARVAKPALRLLASLPSVSVGLGAALVWRRVAPGGGPLAPAALALGALAVPALVVRGDRLLADAAPLREAALAVGARRRNAFFLVVWPAVRPRAWRALVDAVLALTGEAALVVVIARALGAAPPTLASSLAERPASAGALALALGLSLALGALASLPAEAPERA